MIGGASSTVNRKEPIAFYYSKEQRPELKRNKESNENVKNKRMMRFLGDKP